MPFQRLGEFEIRREIGRGGMGVVYEAWQASLDRVVALKVLDRQVSASKVAVARFQREAQAAAKLHHPHIVPIYAQGQTDGTYYYAMELVEGDSVAAMIHKTRSIQTADTASLDLDATIALSRDTVPVNPEETQPLRRLPNSNPTNDSNVTLGAGEPRLAGDDVRSIVRHIADVCNALAFAHDHGVIHRDIKPHNLLLGGDGRLRISDFGLARLAEQPGVTMTGEIVGSPLYMSPEQITGAPGDVDHRTDVYSLGATLYEWLSLTPPFPGDTRERVISRILTTEPPPIRKHNPRIPVELETICAKALERDASRRYQNAAALRDDLLRYLDHRPLMARRPGLGPRFMKSVRRHPVVAIAIVAIAIGGGLFSALLSTRSRAVRESQAAAIAQGQTEEILDTLGPELLALMRSAQAVQGLVGSGITPSNETGKTPSTNARPEPSVGSPTAIALRATREFYLAVTPPDWITNLSLLSGTDGQVDPLLFNLQEADRLWKDGEPGRAVGLLDAYLAARPNDFAARQMHAALCAEQRAFQRLAEDAAILVRLDSQSVHAYVWRGIASLLLENFERSTIDLTWATELDRRSVWAKVMLGLAKIGQGRAPGALLDFEDALRENNDLAIALLGRASAFAADGRFDDAVGDANLVLESEPDNADALTIRGDCHAARERYGEAARDYQAAMNVVGRTTELALRYLNAVVQQRQGNKGDTSGPADGDADAVHRGQPTIKRSTDKSSERGLVEPLMNRLARFVRP